MSIHDTKKEKIEDIKIQGKDNWIKAATIMRFKELIASGMQEPEAAEACGLKAGIAKQYLKKYAKQALTELRLELFASLKHHVKDNASACVFAAKAKLGWQDVTKIEQNQTVEYVDLPAQETREQWVKRQGLRAVKAG